MVTFPLDMTKKHHFSGITAEIWCFFVDSIKYVTIKTALRGKFLVNVVTFPLSLKEKAPRHLDLLFSLVTFHEISEK